MSNRRAVRARALPAQSQGGGIGRGGYPRHTRAAARGVGVGGPPSEKARVDDYATLLVKVEASR